MLVLGDTPLRVLGFQTPETRLKIPKHLTFAKNLKNTGKSYLISVLPLSPPTGGDVRLRGGLRLLHHGELDVHALELSRRPEPGLFDANRARQGVHAKHGPVKEAP